MKLYNVIFPIWLLMYFPPLILGVLPLNLLIDSLVIYFILKYLKVKYIKKIYFNIIFKVWIIGFIADIIGVLILLSSFLIKNNAFNEAIVRDPFKHIGAFTFVIMTIIIVSILIYYLNNKLSFKNTHLKKNHKKIIALFLAIITAPYLFLLPTEPFYKLDTLDDYRNTYLSDMNSVKNIVELLEIGPYSDNINVIDSTITIKLNTEMSSIKLYQNLEEEAAITFNLIMDVETVTYNYQNKVYNFKFDNLNKIYNNSLRNINILSIKERYNSNQFISDSIYMGNVLGYDIFDESTTCEEKEEFLMEDSKNNYYVKCSFVDQIYAYKDNQKYLIKDIINKIDINSLKETNLQIITKEK